MDVLKFLNTYWLIIGSIFCGFAWLIRLESKILNLENNISKNHDSYKELWLKINDIQISLNAIATSLARLEGRLEGSKHD